jgi:MoaA/NifB/PqqE/SkfB family radical SAM enzyme|tara:strand:+ start:15277 stop:16248 length:972 start_codon:yes stop_codon:yes gene_type:complete
MILDQVNKRQDVGEIIVTLFEYCNLSCKFCNQDHNDLLGTDTITQKIELVQQEIKRLNKKSYSVHFMGGEVFADSLPDQVFYDYNYVVNEINKWSRKEGYDVELCFTTNFVFTNTSRLDKLLAATGIKLLTSYDPSARFNKNTFKIFRENVERYKHNIKSVNVIMTKPSIKKFMNNDVPFFDTLYDLFGIYFDYYTPEKNMDMFLPTDVMLRDFMIYMLDKYPKVLPFSEMKNKMKKKMSCMDTITIMPNGSKGACTILLKGFKKPNVKKVAMEEEWFEQYQCLTCDHFQYCNMGCFLSNHIQSFRTQEACYLSEVYDVVHAN